MGGRQCVGQELARTNLGSNSQRKPAGRGEIEVKHLTLQQVGFTILCSPFPSSPELPPSPTVPLLPLYSSTRTGRQPQPQPQPPPPIPLTPPSCSPPSRSFFPRPPLAPIPSSLGKSSSGAGPGPALPLVHSVPDGTGQRQADRGRRTDRSLFPAPSQGLAPPPPSHQAFLHRPCCDVAAGLSRAPAAPPSALGCGLSAAHNLQTRHPLCGLLARAPTALTPATQPSTPSLSCPAASPAPCATPYGVSTGGPTEPQHLIPLSPLTSAILGRSD